MHDDVSWKHVYYDYLRNHRNLQNPLKPSNEDDFMMMPLPRLVKRNGDNWNRVMKRNDWYRIMKRNAMIDPNFNVHITKRNKMVDPNTKAIYNQMSNNLRPVLVCPLP